MSHPKHDHFTRDIKPPGSGCPACEAFWAKAREIGKEMEKQYGTKQEGLKRNPNRPVKRFIIVPPANSVGDAG